MKLKGLDRGLQPGILNLFAAGKGTKHLAAFTQEVLRGEGALTPLQRETIFAYTSGLNGCHF